MDLVLGRRVYMKVSHLFILKLLSRGWFTSLSFLIHFYPPFLKSPSHFPMKKALINSEKNKKTYGKQKEECSCSRWDCPDSGSRRTGSPAGMRSPVIHRRHALTGRGHVVREKVVAFTGSEGFFQLPLRSCEPQHPKLQRQTC